MEENIYILVISSTKMEHFAGNEIFQNKVQHFMKTTLMKG